MSTVQGEVFGNVYRESQVISKWICERRGSGDHIMLKSESLVNLYRQMGGVSEYVPR